MDLISGWAFPSELLDQVDDSSICSNQPDGTLLPDSSDDSMFYECDNHKALKFHCPGRLYFDVKKRVCQFRDDGITNLPPHTDSKFNCTGRANGYYADDKDRSAFHECVSGYAYDFHCPGDTVFDSRLKACSYDGNTVKPVTVPTTEAPTYSPTGSPTESPTDFPTGSPTEVTTNEPLETTTRGRHNSE